MIKILKRVDSIVQVNDKFRIDVSQSLRSPNEAAIDHVKIKPQGEADFITVGDTLDPETWYLDWVFDTTGSKTFDIEIKAGAVTVTDSGTIEVKTAASERLFATDADLLIHEHDILKWVPRGRSSWNHVHREVQTKIMFEIEKSRIVNNDSSKVTLEQVLDIEQFRQWAQFKALAIIFNGINNSVDDVFIAKTKEYAKKDFEGREWAMNKLVIDTNKNGTEEKNERRDHRTTVLVKR